MKNLKDWQLVSILGSAGYLTTILLLGIFIGSGDDTGRGPGFQIIAFAYLAMSILPFMIILPLSYVLMRNKISGARNIKNAAAWGWVASLIVTFVTPALSSIGAELFDGNPKGLPFVSGLLLQALWYSVAGMIYGLPGSVIFGCLAGALIFKNKPARPGAAA